MSLQNISPDDVQIVATNRVRPKKYTGQYGEFRSIEEIDSKYRNIFRYPFFNLVQSQVIENALYSDNSLVVCAPTGSGKTVVFEMAIAKLLMDLEDQGYTEDFKIIYMAPVKAICTERLTEWYAKFTELGVLCIEVTGDTDVDFSQLKPYRIIITTPEKWDILTRRWTDHRSLVEVIKLFLIDEVHILNDECRGPVLEAVVSRMRTIEASCITSHRNEILKRKVENNESLAEVDELPPRIRFVAVSATVSNPEDVAAWLGNAHKPAVYHKFGDECRPVKINRIVEGYPCPAGTSIFKFDIILNYKLWAIIQRYYFGKPTLIFCNTRKGVVLTAETLSREITITFNPEQLSKLTALASSIKNKKLQTLVLSGVGCHHAGMLFEERVHIEQAFRNRDLPILITTTTLAMGVNLPAHLVIIKNTQYYVNGAYQEYPISTVLQMIGRAGRPQFDNEATAVIMTRAQDKCRYQSLVGGSEPLQSYLHRRLAENLNSEAALHTVTDLAQCVDWLRSTFLFVRAGRDPRRYLNLPANATPQHISKKIEDLCVKAMNGLATSGLITINNACCIESTEAGRLMSIFYIDFETMKYIMKIDGTESLERLLWVLCESHELSEMHLRVDERRCLNTLNRSNRPSATIRFPMKGKISTRQMKLSCIIQAILGGLAIPEPALNQEATRIMRIADRVCKCMVSYITRPEVTSRQSPFYAAILNGITLAKCIVAQLWENSPYVCRQLRGIGPAFSTSLVTAGKNNFLLLEESHPRDLERIMNKGPPAGNILRKQISLLPKYQLTLAPLDHKTVSIKVSLLNQAYLSENIDSLTAGSNHKVYVIIGDADNSLLLFTYFRDMDLINVYDGCITYLVDRKHKYEHKIIVNCISATFVGIDVSAEYIFKKADYIQNESSINQPSSPKRVTTNKQSTITDMFKEKKRKTNVMQYTEKNKRNNAIMNEINSLKQTLGYNCKELEVQLQNSEIISHTILNEINNKIKNGTETSHVYKENETPTKLMSNFNDEELPVISFSHSRKDNMSNPIKDNSTFDNEMETEDSLIDLPDYERIKNILNKVENEIMVINEQPLQVIESEKSSMNTNMHKSDIKLMPSKITNFTRKRSLKQTNKQKQDNFAFLELLDKNVENVDVEESIDKDIYDGGFSKTIKLNLDMFLQKTKDQNIGKQQNIMTLLSNDIITDVKQCSQTYTNQQTITERHLNKSVKKIEFLTEANDNISYNNNVEHKNIVELLSNDIITHVKQCSQINTNQQIMTEPHVNTQVEKKYFLTEAMENISYNINVEHENAVKHILSNNTTNHKESIKENKNKFIQNINSISSHVLNESNSNNNTNTMEEILAFMPQNYNANISNQSIAPIHQLTNNNYIFPHTFSNNTTKDEINNNNKLNTDTNTDVIKCHTDRSKCNDILSQLTNIQNDNNTVKYNCDLYHNSNDVGKNSNIYEKVKSKSDLIVKDVSMMSNSAGKRNMVLYNNLIPKYNNININNLSNDNTMYALNSNMDNTYKPKLINDILCNMNSTDNNVTPIFTKTTTVNNSNEQMIIVNSVDKNMHYNIKDNNSLNKSTIDDTRISPWCDNKLSDPSVIDQGLDKIQNHYKNTNNDNGRTKFIKMSNFKTSIASNISNYQVNYHENKKLTKCQLELIKKYTLDLDLVDVFNKEKCKKYEDFKQTPNHDNDQQSQVNILSSRVNNNLNSIKNVSNIIEIPTNMQRCVLNPIDLNLSKHTDNRNDLVRYCTNINNEQVVPNLTNTKKTINYSQIQEQCANVNKHDSTLTKLNPNKSEVEIMPSLQIDAKEQLVQPQIQKRYDIENDNKKTILNNTNVPYLNGTTVLSPELVFFSKINKLDNVTKSLNIAKDNNEENKSVKDILSKYFNVLRKTDINMTPHDTENIKNRDTTNETSFNKTQRLFQIRDINHIDVEIPNSLIPNIPSHTSIEEVEHFIENKQNDYDQLKINEIIEASSLQINSDKCETKHEVDQSLLDPKKLLECYEDNNETIDILPPPLEFADNISHVNKEFNDKDWDFMDVDNSYSDILLNYNSNSGEPLIDNFIDEKKLFHDVSGPSVASVNMSISHEVETWTLTPENDTNDSLCDSSMKSLTVMRTKPIYSAAANFNRKDKFSTFKFKNKERFRFRK